MIIGHYEREIWANGGMATYIRHLGSAQRKAGHTVHYLSQKPSVDQSLVELPTVVEDETALYLQAEKLNLDILHLHTTVQTLPPNSIASIRTCHIHEPYCPAGSKYLTRWNRPCERSYNLYGCLWGHLVDHCGSVRPHKLQNGFQTTWHEMQLLPHIPVITLSQFVKEQMLRSGYPETSIHSLTLFAPELFDYSPPTNEGVPRFAFLGRITPQKGLDWLLRAVQKVTIPVHLDIAGDGYQASKMQQLAQQLGISEKVTFHGWLQSDQINHLVHESRAVIFPSVWHEPAGFVALEAMARSRAVIVSRVGGAPEVVVDEVNGLLVEPNDISDLSHCIELLATNWALAKSLGDEGRTMVKKQFTLEHHLKELMQIYHQTINQKTVKIA